MENAESNPSFDDKIMKAFKPVWGFSDCYVMADVK